MHDILDLNRYPLDRPGSPEWQALVDRCRAELAQDGMFSLDGLMQPEVAQGAADALQGKFATESFHHKREHNIYFKDSVEGLAPDHPALQKVETSNFTLCADQFQGSPVLRLYDWPPFAEFLAATMDKQNLYTMDDPLARLNIMSYGAEQALNWHFDRSEFTTTMLLQAPDEGGEFIYSPELRSDDDPNYPGVERLLAGEDPNMRAITLSPGTLNIFRGKNSPHRVGTVKGDKHRVIAVFTFYERPGVRFTDEENIGFYGRAS
ncbi:HalD/BesD family halogenase [Leisingera methylohalidivorans]|uniref:2OG-Fe(II) oxygenase n=1 Tax=Leisingera methylohalidivorans DSM 14336 TaxID=999552 RepID=V9VTW4_9RHOB|nr:2OG-Fe(II) oxygenase [Leisingera methylohalidivorans]AHD00287.1 2OG-Fe(II) oxygenase [Leisingera methylohalidivorans DSM 14336]